MQIFCPKCNAGYEIDDELLKDKARRVKCGECGEVFVVDKIEELAQEDAFSLLSKEFDEESDYNNENETVERQEQSVSGGVSEVEDSSSEEEQKADIIETQTEESADSEKKSDNDSVTEENEEDFDIEDIFERLSERTENLILEEKKLPFYKKIILWIKNIFGFQFKINWKYVSLAAVLASMIWMYNNRYDIVRNFAFMNSIYKVLGINAKIVGEGLEFQNISWNFVSNGEESRLDIRGFIFNQTDKDIVIPTVHVEILDKETVLLQSQNRKLEAYSVSGGEKIPMLLSINNPAPTMKYVYMTFIDVD